MYSRSIHNKIRINKDNTLAYANTGEQLSIKESEAFFSYIPKIIKTHDEGLSCQSIIEELVQKRILDGKCNFIFITSSRVFYLTYVDDDDKICYDVIEDGTEVSKAFGTGGVYFSIDADAGIYSAEEIFKRVNAFDSSVTAEFDSVDMSSLLQKLA